MFKWFGLALALFAAPALAQQAQVSSATKTFDNNSTAPLQLDINGNLKTVSSASTPPTGASATEVQGTAAHDAPAVGKPVQAAGVWAGNNPTSVSTAGEVTRLLTTSYGSLVVQPVGNQVATAADNASGVNYEIGEGSQGQYNTRAVQLHGATAAGSPRYVRNDENGLVTQSDLHADWWRYAAAVNGISNTTTAVTLQAAPGANICLALKTLTMSTTTLGAATEVAVRDGAGGTVMWRAFVGTAGGSRDIIFDPPLKGTANTLLEFVTLTATVTGSVYHNASGFKIAC